MLTASGVASPGQCINPTPANQINQISMQNSSSQPTNSNQQLAMPTTNNQHLTMAMLAPDSCVEVPPSSPMIFSNNPTITGYQPGTPVPGYQPGAPGYQTKTQVYQPSTPGYHPGTPVYQPGTPGYQPSPLVYQPATPGYQPLIAQQGAFIFDPNCIPTEDIEKISATSTPEPQKSPTTPPTRRLDFTSSRPLGTSSFKKGLERGVRKDPCKGDCFVCPNDPPEKPSGEAIPSNDGDQAREEQPAPTKTEEVAPAPPSTEGGKGGAGGGQMEGWNGMPGVHVEMPRQFVYPGPGYYNYPGSGYYNNVPLAPLTPITPSVDPALGFKTGYIEPQTPNPMTPNQFYYYFQASPFPYSPMDGAPAMGYQPIQGQPIQGHPGQTIQGHPVQTSHGHPVHPIQGRTLAQSLPIQADPVQLSQPPPGKSINENFQRGESSHGGAFTFIKPAAKKIRPYIENNNRPYSGNKPYNNNTSYFTSPFKTFTNFRGTPSPTRYPLRSPNYRPAHHVARMNVNRQTNKRNLSVTNSQDNANPTGETNTDTKANWYKAGERFGVSSTFQKRNKSVNDLAAPSSGLTPPQTPLSMAEPDLIAGQMRNISLK